MSDFMPTSLISAYYLFFFLFSFFFSVHYIPLGTSTNSRFFAEKIAYDVGPKPNKKEKKKVLSLKFIISKFLIDLFIN